MDKTAGHMMGPMGLMDDDAKMLCKVLEISAAQALSLKKKIKMGHKLPSWAEYKIYKAGDALTSAMASTHSMRDHMPKITISIKSGPSLGSVLPSNMSKSAMMGNSQFTQQTLKGSGLPGYSKGGAVKKDGYLTDKKGKPYARVHRGEKVVPKDEKADGTAKDKTANYREGGSFTHDGKKYDLDRALSVADAKNITYPSVKSLEWVLKHDTPDLARLTKADVNAPLLVARDSRGRLTVIDGLHRLAKAQKQGTKKLPSRVLNRKDLSLVENTGKFTKTAGYDKTKKAWATLSKGK